MDEKKASIKGATIFISGSQKITIADEEGLFSFPGLTPGTYTVMIKMLGYFPVTENVTITISLSGFR